MKKKVKRSIAAFAWCFLVVGILTDALCSLGCAYGVQFAYNLAVFLVSPLFADYILDLEDE